MPTEIVTPTRETRDPKKWIADVFIHLRVKSYEFATRNIRVEGPPHLAAARAIRHAQQENKSKLHRRRIARVSLVLIEIPGRIE